MCGASSGSRRARSSSALAADLGKSPFEAYATDVGAILSETGLLLRHLPKLVRPRRIRTPLLSQPARTTAVPEPWGAVLVFPAWNYPVALSLLPMVGAVAAGNTVVVKPSELAAASSALLAEHLSRYVDPDVVSVVPGGPDVAEALLTHRFGHIHYTGNARIGRVVMRAAADHLTPVTLELGGKNPAYVHGDTDVAITARRIFWGRLFNAGQTCMSPDYVLVQRSAEGPLLDAMVAWARSAYGADPAASPDLGRMVNDRHFDRVVGLLDGAGEIVLRRRPRPRHPLHRADDRAGRARRTTRSSARRSSGRCCPIVAVDAVDEAIDHVNRGTEPLTMYLFTEPAGRGRPHHRAHHRGLRRREPDVHPGVQPVACRSAVWGRAAWGRTRVSTASSASAT